MVNLIKIEKQEEMTNDEDLRTSEIHHAGKKWTRGVPIILVSEDKHITITNHWVYINKNDELVYNKAKTYGVRVRSF
ncbi:hypothetical protein [Brevibacillus laterosporus]|uniref:hypothetical protein n=1 Tax=Brevibacillus laterosporus TaxID=1465 RepID=UPI003CF7536B